MNKYFLILGDIFAILAITLIGFVTHRETGMSFLPRIAAIYFPLSIAWFLLAPGLGLFQGENLHNARQLWRPALAASFAASLAVVLRGLILNAPIIPIFAAVLSIAFAVGMTFWRGLFLLLSRKTN